MRFALLLAAVLSVPSPAYGQFVFEDYIAHANSTITVPVLDPAVLSPADFHFEANWLGDPGGFKLKFDLHGVTPADVGTVFEIHNAAEAAPFGLDFDRVAYLTSNHWPKITEFVGVDPAASISTPLGTFVKGVCCNMSFQPPGRNRKWELERMRIHIAKFALVPEEQRVYFRVHLFLIPVRPPITPEPSSAALLLIGLVTCCHRRR